MAQTKERLRQLRQKYGLGEYGNRRAGARKYRTASGLVIETVPRGFRGIKSASRRGSVRMAKRRFGRRSKGGGFGMKGLLKAVIAGAIGDEIGQRYIGPAAPQIPMPDKLGAAAAGYVVKKSLVGAAAGVAGGMLKDVVLYGGQNGQGSTKSTMQFL